MKKLLLITCILLGMIAKAQGTKVYLRTNYGDITLMLYDDTPLHRDNFIKLVNNGWYNGSPFHRIIHDFMIQAGQNTDGRLDPGYKIPAEIKSNHFHKKGALAAARQSDHVNPQKMSSGSQFYIVQGQLYNDLQLNRMESMYGKVFSATQRQTYKTLGGSPHLDGDYTVFGEVVDGLDVVDRIAYVKTNGQDAPIDPVTIISASVTEFSGKVEGKGTTELEDHVIRWEINSRPQGADIYWRVVSSTPDVKSTNLKYIMTTPYEATKTLDIKGLSERTIGNVRIIIRCEKDGYLPQEKEFDLRMVYDQEEISAFCKLVKDE